MKKIICISILIFILSFAIKGQDNVNISNEFAFDEKNNRLEINLAEKVKKVRFFSEKERFVRVENCTPNNKTLIISGYYKTHCQDPDSRNLLPVPISMKQQDQNYNKKYFSKKNTTRFLLPVADVQKNEAVICTRSLFLTITTDLVPTTVLFTTH